MSGSQHSGHAYELLLSRWREVAETTGLILRTLCEAGGHPVVVLENGLSEARTNGGFYVSAGVHGDECAPVWGLLDWAAGNPAILRKHPVIIFPCLNPVGLLDNTRRDGNGIDLNRCFGDPAHPVIAAWQSHLANRQFEVALNLHEDYDANGIYLYELTRTTSIGNTLLSSVEEIIPREPSNLVDGSDFQNGLLVRGGDVEQVVADQLGGGYPEAILLYLRYAASSYTFETPSEFDLYRRIAAHRAFLEATAGTFVK